MLKIYNKEHKEEWNRYVKSFDNWDIYYLYEYAYSFMLHGDGDIFLIVLENGHERCCYVVMQKDISEFLPFRNVIEKNKYYDWETPYGYGGPLTDYPISYESQKIFQKELTDYCKKNNIVSQFIRFHPLLKNYEILPDFIESRYLRDTIFIDTTDKDLIMKNMDSKNRNMVRKAKKNNVSIEIRDINDNKDFIDIYNTTMKHNCADEYYIFDQKYFTALNDLCDNAKIWYAYYEDKPIAASIMFYNEKYIHYHLSGSYPDQRKNAPTNLLLYETACWASDHEIKQFHLGGGMSEDDNLFGFKKQFNKNGRAKFVVGKTIFNKDIYDKLLQIRKNKDINFDVNNSFMIQYRR